MNGRCDFICVILIIF